MPTDDRFTKLEVKVDNVQEDLSELKSDFKLHMQENKYNQEVIKAHVAADSRIVAAIQPLVNELPTLIEIAKEYHWQKMTKHKKESAVAIWTKRLAILASSVTFLAGIVKIMEML